MSDVIKTHLFDIAQTFAGLENLVESGEVSAEDAADTFEAIEGEFDQKVMQILAMMRNYAAFAASAKDEAARLSAVAASAGRREAWLREYIKTNMIRVGKKTVKTIHGTCTISDGADSVVIDDVLKIPDEFLIYDPEAAYTPKKSEIKEAIKAGVAVPGAHLTTGDPVIKITNPRKSKESEE